MRETMEGVALPIRSNMMARGVYLRVPCNTQEKKHDQLNHGVNNSRWVWVDGWGQVYRVVGGVGRQVDVASLSNK